MNDKGMSFPVFEKAVSLFKRGRKLNIREINSNKMVLENDDFVIEVVYKGEKKEDGLHCED